VKPVAVKTQTAGVAEARRQLARTGGGELRLKGRDGKVRDSTTVARPDPRKSKAESGGHRPKTVNERRLAEEASALGDGVTAGVARRPTFARNATR